jgi:hypothetical protein
MMANYRGQDGSATVATNAVGELKAWALDGVTIETIEDTVKGDKHKTYLGGLGDGGSASLTCQLDGADAGQAAIIGYFAAATPQSAAVAVVLTVNTGKTFSFSAVPTSMSVGSPEGSSIDTATFNFKVSGAVTMAWV